MKMLYLARRPIPSVNANSVQIVTMCEAFAALGHEVTLVAHPGDDAPDTIYERYGVARDFAIETLPRHGQTARKWRYLLELGPLERRLEPDLLFGRDIWSLVRLAGRGKPLIYEAHIIPRTGSIRWRLLRHLFSRPNFAHLVCVTSTLAELYRAQFPELAGRPVLVAPNAASEPVDDGAPLPWPGRPGHLQVGFVGRPFPGKGIEALAAAANDLPDADFHIIGSARADVTWIADPLPPNLHFHGYQLHGVLGRFYRYLDVAAAPYGATVQNASGAESAAITSPLKLIESMAAGLPAIVSDLPGVRDMVPHGEGVLLIPPGDRQALVAAIRTLSDRAVRQEVAAAARRAYEERHTAEARARKVLGRFADRRKADAA